MWTGFVLFGLLHWLFDGQRPLFAGMISFAMVPGVKIGAFRVNQALTTPNLSPGLILTPAEPNLMPARLTNPDLR